MKKPIAYILSILLIAVSIYYVKMYLNNNSTNSISKHIELENNTVIKAEIEILNGCGESGIANLYSNYLIKKGFDVIDSRNADNFEYLNTTIIVHKKDKLNIAKNLANILKIKKVTIDERGIWDLSLIIGRDYKNLDSFETVKKHFPPF
tara:strand:- start:13536 stop:13982 length:447 start_codon:yes stop_codon:yes gene_type:complete